jgi:hypothetical protein
MCVKGSGVNSGFKPARHCWYLTMGRPVTFLTARAKVSRNMMGTGTLRVREMWTGCVVWTTHLCCSCATLGRYLLAGASGIFATGRTLGCGEFCSDRTTS